jgi:hypothetical protein
MTNWNRFILLAAVGYVVAAGAARPSGLQSSPPQTAVGGQNNPAAAAVDLNKQSQADVDRKSAGCLTCHTPDERSMHERAVRAGCTDCHGGRADVRAPEGAGKGSAGYDNAKGQAHVQPRLNIWPASGANPVRAAAATNAESLEFLRFVNPGDLRVADRTCGACHPEETANAGKSMMRHGAMLWGAALYNNGSFPFKNYQFGEFYMPDGTPAQANTVPPPGPREIRGDGVLPFLLPLPRWEISQPGNILRIFERGGRRPLEPGNPDPEEEPGRPANRLSARGLGTLNRTDPVFIGLQKTRLLDPTTNFFGTNDQPGDYRSSGCSACHVVYANDRSPVHSGPYASAGNMGETQTSDRAIAKSDPKSNAIESGHPIKHVMTRAIPTSQCITCHMHPGTNVMNTYLGFMWWDNETDGDLMYPKATRRLSGRERSEIEARNPEGSALKGLWSDPRFLRDSGKPPAAGQPAVLNQQLKQTQFADFHGHGWMFRAVFKRDRQGRLLDDAGAVVPSATPQQLAAAVANTEKRARPGLPVHLKDIHLERGMHCVDCHFNGDAHGDGKLYGETRNPVQIACVDCHGTTTARATLTLSGFGVSERTRADLVGRNTPFPDPDNAEISQPQFVVPDDPEEPIRQYSMVTRGLSWVIPQIRDSVTPSNPLYNAKAARAKTMQRDGKTWGAAAASDRLAHTAERFTCQTCHTSWMTSCFGCHLNQRANEKKPMLHNEGTDTKNWTSYNFQVLRDEVFMLGIDGTATGNRISPVRSSSAVLVSSETANRQLVYHQQQTVSAEGYSGQAFNPHVPHTVRKTETRTCTDCHVSSAGDNNAWLAQLLLQGTNFVNFMGRHVYVATGKSGIEAVEVTELEEPQAVIGSDLHRLAYPEQYAAHQSRGRTLKGSEHHGSSDAQMLQLRGEYLYIADGAGGFRVFDVAQIDQKDFSERITTAPVSPIGQRLSVKTPFASAIAAPSTLAVDPVRIQRPQNEEQPIHDLYKYIYIADRQDGLVLSTAATLLDGNPTNNFLQRAATFNPGGVLTGATAITLAGHYAYLLTDRGIVIVNLDKPLQPVVAAQIGAPIRAPKAIAVQFRYVFVVDADGLKVIDVTVPERARVVSGAVVPIAQARSVYVARTYAYIAAGSAGIAIVNVERPESPRLDRTFNADGAINDAYDVKVAMTNASVFGYVADGKNGLRVLQLISANETPGAFGFSPRPEPKLIATYKTHGPALSISKGLDRDRAVDESGHQVAVFGRRGARPFTLQEMQRMFLRDGQVFSVTDAPAGDERAPGLPQRPAAAQPRPAQPQRGAPPPPPPGRGRGRGRG